MMGTRSGCVDPAILTYLLREARTRGEALDEELNRKSGLFGISGVSGDMRHFLSRNEGRKRMTFHHDDL